MVQHILFKNFNFIYLLLVRIIINIGILQRGVIMYFL